MANNLINFPEDIEISDAMRMYDEGTAFDIVKTDFILDTNDKVDACTGIVNGIQGMSGSNREY